MIYHGINWWMMFLIPVLWVLQNLIHELSHAMVLARHGWDYKIYPFYHWYNFDTAETKYCLSRPEEAGRWKWYFARIDKVHTAEAENLSTSDWAVVDVMPRVTNTVLFLLCAVLYITVPQNGHFHTFLMMFAFFNSVDAVAGWLPIFCWWNKKELMDIVRFVSRTNLTRRQAQVIAICWTITAATVFFLPWESFFK